MKFSERWLREWFDPNLDSHGLAAQLTAAGLEVDAVAPVAQSDLDKVVVGHVLEARTHPDADRLRVCSVDVGGPQPLDIVCGAANARADLWAPVALPGARLAGGLKIRKSKIRGLESNGMLCSPRELGLGDDADGLLELSGNLRAGACMADLLDLDDTIIDVDLTPNRGDGLYLEGLARDVAALNGARLEQRVVAEVPALIDDVFPVRLDAARACPRYVGRVIRGIDTRAHTPLWMKEKLRRCGVRALSPVVDVTNYVMLELGHPMHAFDLDELVGGIHVRQAIQGERAQLLDDSELALEASDLVIADDAGNVALAGIMGGRRSAVSDRTRNVFLECAWFEPQGIGITARRLGLHTDASHRFERVVNPQGQMRAVQRATQLLLELCGGSPGPVVDTCEPDHLPASPCITLRASRIRRLLGVEVPGDEVRQILENLHMEVERGDEAGTWRVTPPPYRPDIGMEADLVEEIVRVRGYDSVPEQAPVAALSMSARAEAVRDLGSLRRILVARGYQEAITYSFVDGRLQRRLDPSVAPVALSNPISSDMDVMRTSLLPGLLGAVVHNLNRQQERVKLFESGLVFRDEGGAETLQRPMLGGVAVGARVPGSWQGRAPALDFFDVKSDVQALFGSAGSQLGFQAFEHPALHPGQSAQVLLAGRPIGILGMLHPQHQNALKLPLAPLLFELQLAALARATVPEFRPFSRYPAVTRDLSLVVDDGVSVQTLMECVGQAAGDMLQNLELFDVYRGEGIDSGQKSLSFTLTFQDASRTLDDSEVDASVKKILDSLAEHLGATLRD